MTTHHATAAPVATVVRHVVVTLLLVAGLLGCKEREVVYEPLWQGDVISPSFGDGASSADTVSGGADAAATDGGALGDSASGPDILGSDVGDGGPMGDGASGDATTDTAQDAGDGTIADAQGDVADAVDSSVADADAGGDAGGDGSADSDAGPTVPTSFVIWSEVLQPWGCTSAACHGSKTEWPLFVDVFSFRALLVGKAAVGPCAPGILVKPGDPDGSVMVHKVDPKVSTCGLEMPTKGGVDAATVKLLRAWVAAGAPP